MQQSSFFLPCRHCFVFPYRVAWRPLDRSHQKADNCVWLSELSHFNLPSIAMKTRACDVGNQSIDHACECSAILPNATVGDEFKGTAGCVCADPMTRPQSNTTTF